MKNKAKCKIYDKHIQEGKMKMKKRLLMTQYKIKKFIRTKKIKDKLKEIIIGAISLAISVIGTICLVAIFSVKYVDDKETIKLISAATSILVIIELYDTIRKVI